MKKWISISLAVLLSIICIPFGGEYEVNAGTKDASDKKLKIVATIFPEYDWARAVLGDCLDEVELTMLLDNGTDLHSFQPAVKDIMKVSSCDLLIYVGGESDQWIEDVLESAQNENMQTINLMEVLEDRLKEEETVEGMQGHNHSHTHEEEHHHDEAEEEDEEHHHEDDHDAEYDEHVWTSLRNAAAICDTIAETLGEMDPKHQSDYRQNAQVYKEKLSALDQKFQDAVDEAEQKTLVFADRFPFRYFVEDYGLEYYAAFSGCSAESEASFKTITFLAEKLDDLGVKTVLTIEKADDRIAQTVIENTETKDQNILELNSMQAITSEEIEAGTDYLSVMEENLNVIKEALQ